MRKYIILLSLTLFVLTSCATRIDTAVPSNQLVIVKKVPRNHKVVYVKGKKYYYWNGRYHRKTARGYIVEKI
jgi:uncharacterized protein YcfL